MSVYNPQNQSFLEQLDFMSTDIRQQKKDLIAARAIALAAQGTASNAISIGQAAQQAADTVSNAVQTITGTVETLSVEMVRKFKSGPIAAIAFELDTVAGYYYALVSHMLGDAAPDVEVYDNDGDKQRIQSTILDNNTIRLELDSEDLASNSFPLTCICLGKNTPDVGLETLMPGGQNSYRLQAGLVQRRSSGGGEWLSLYGGAISAFLSADLRVYAYLANGSYNWMLDGSDVSNVISESDYADAKMLPTSIDL